MRDVCEQHMLIMIVCNWQNVKNVVMLSMDTNSQKLYLSLTDTKSVGNNTIEWLPWRRQSRTIGILLLFILVLVLVLVLVLLLITLLLLLLVVVVVVVLQYYIQHRPIPVFHQAASIWCIIAPWTVVDVFIIASGMLSRQRNISQLRLLRSATSHPVYSTVQVSGQVNLSSIITCTEREDTAHTVQRTV